MNFDETTRRAWTNGVQKVIAQQALRRVERVQAKNAQANVMIAAAEAKRAMRQAKRMRSL